MFGENDSVSTIDERFAWEQRDQLAKSLERSRLTDLALRRQQMLCSLIGYADTAIAILVGAWGLYVGPRSGTIFGCSADSVATNFVMLAAGVGVVGGWLATWIRYQTITTRRRVFEDARRDAAKALARLDSALGYNPAKQEPRLPDPQLWSEA